MSDEYKQRDGGRVRCLYGHLIGVGVFFGGLAWVVLLQERGRRWWVSGLGGHSCNVVECNVKVMQCNAMQCCPES